MHIAGETGPCLGVPNVVVTRWGPWGVLGERGLTSRDFSGFYRVNITRTRGLDFNAGTSSEHRGRLTPVRGALREQAKVGGWLLMGGAAGAARGKSVQRIFVLEILR